MTLIEVLRNPFDKEASPTLGLDLSEGLPPLYGEVFADCEIVDFNYATRKLTELRETAAQKQYWSVADYWRSL